MSKDEGWVLYYHNGFPGRGEFVRLVFEEAGVKYTNFKGPVADIIKGNKYNGYPAFAPPMIKKGDFNLSQTGVIIRYLGKKFGLWPETEEDEWHADQVNCTALDFHTEGAMVFHGKNFMDSYDTQKEETKPYIEWFKQQRFSKWLGVLEKSLAANNGGHGFVVGNKLTYVDLTLLHVLRAASFQFPEEWDKLDSIPLLKAFKDRISARPNLADYFKSDRCLPFSGASMM